MNKLLKRLWAEWKKCDHFSGSDHTVRKWYLPSGTMPGSGVLIGPITKDAIGESDIKVKDK